jgi:hypothetical protein
MANPLTINILLAVSANSMATGTILFFRRVGMTAASIGVLGFFGGCVAPDPPKAPSIAPVIIPVARPTTLTDAADSALKAAEQSVIEARIKRALWTAAVEHLGQARAAASVFDSTATLAHAKEVVALCALSIQQTALPPVKW